MQMPTIVSKVVTEEIHHRVVTFKARDSSAGNEYSIRVLFSDIGISTGIYPTNDKELVEYAEDALALRCANAKCQADISEIRLNTSNEL